MKRNSLWGSLLLVLVAAVWGTALVFQRMGMDQVEPITFNASRMTLAAMAVGPVCAFFKGKTDFATLEEKKAYARNTVVGGICCGVFLALASMFQQMGVVYTTAGKAGFITVLYLLIVPILNFVFFKKRGTWLVWVAVLLGVAGMYLLCLTEGFRLTYGDTLICICAVLYSGHILCCDYFAGRGDPLRLSAIQFVTTALISWTAAFIVEEPAWSKITAAAIPILYCGFMSGGLGYTLQIVAQKYTDPTVASLLMSMESVFGVIAGTLFLHERMSKRELMGCVVMFAAIILVQIPLPGKKRKKADS